MNSVLTAFLAHYLPSSAFSFLFTVTKFKVEGGVDMTKPGEQVQGFMDEFMKFFESQNLSKENMLGLLIIAGAAIFAKLKNIMVGVAVGVAGFIALAIGMGEDGSLTEIVNNLIGKVSPEK
jgi:hypothetical protein